MWEVAVGANSSGRAESAAGDAPHAEAWAVRNRSRRGRARRNRARRRRRTTAGAPRASTRLVPHRRRRRAVQFDWLIQGRERPRFGTIEACTIDKIWGQVGDNASVMRGRRRLG